MSLNSGSQVYAALDTDRYNVLRYDPRTDLPRLVAEATRIDAALIILHGPFGEDGTVQGLLDLLGIPYQGSGVLGSAVAMNKVASKILYQPGRAAHPGLRHRPARRAGSTSTRPWQRLGMPIVVKPAAGGSSVGITIVRSRGALAAALETAYAHDPLVLLEAYIEGTRSRRASSATTRSRRCR